uniref:DUF4371 domain-containing protein n=1 Tax=Biomphalaria glabrata TaxID=6526 RepID=A0A2C9M749_BIOGL
MKLQMSLDVRFVDGYCIREDFFGFHPFVSIDALSVSNVIVREYIMYNLDIDKLLGQGYNGSPVMSSIQNYVQARVREKYPESAFVPLASHRLNLVITDLNNVSDIRHAVGVIKKVIYFFRNSSKLERWC